MYNSNFVNKKKATHKIKQKHSFRDDIYINELIREDMNQSSYRNPSPWKRRQSIGMRQSFIRRQSIGKRQSPERRDSIGKRQATDQRQSISKKQHTTDISKKANQQNSQRPAIIDFLSKIQLSKSNQKSKTVQFNPGNVSHHKNNTSDVKYQKNITNKQSLLNKNTDFNNPQPNKFENIFIFYPKSSTKVKCDQKSKQHQNSNFKLDKVSNISDFKLTHTRGVSLIQFQSPNQFQTTKKSFRAQKLKTQRHDQNCKIVQDQQKIMQNAFATNYLNLRNLKLKNKKCPKGKRSVKTSGQEEDEKDYSDSYLYRTFFNNKRWSNNLNITKTLKIYTKKSFKEHLQKIKKLPLTLIKPEIQN